MLISSILSVMSIYGNKEDGFISLFDNDGIIEITLKFNFDLLYKGGTSEEKKYPAILTLKNDTIEKSMPIFLSKRGHFRKAFNVCTFPPLRFHFSRSEVKGTVFEGIEKIKLVTHCQNADTLFDQYILLEYLLYKSYNFLTERSFKVRLTRITYIDEAGQYNSMVRWAFFIENPSDLAYRINGEVLNIRYIYPEATDPYYYALMSLFQYMIINQDWSIYIAHNVEFIGIYPSLRPVTVPFDFDMAEFIHVPYDSPLLSYRLEKKQERKFLPEKVDKIYMERAINNFRQKREKIKELFIENIFLVDSLKNKSANHINDFYSILDNKPLFRENLIRKRRK